MNKTTKKSNPYLLHRPRQEAETMHLSESRIGHWLQLDLMIALTDADSLGVPVHVRLRAQLLVSLDVTYSTTFTLE